MSSRTKYHTINRDYFLQTAQSFHKPFTAKEIAARLVENENPMGISTIYRLLDDFSAKGVLHKSLASDNTACYFYMKPCKNENHFYLECSKCHYIYHLDCRHLRSFSKHIAKKHLFKITNYDLIINGICEKCQEEAE